MKRIFRDPPALYTERFILRKLVPDDCRDMFEYARDPAVTKYLLWTHHRSEDDTRQFLSYAKRRYKSGDYYDWAVTDRTTGKMIGTCGFTSFYLPANSAEVGYVLGRDYWGRGIAAEALSAVLHFGFEKLRLHRIEAKFMIGNERSLRVMEKVGMKFEGVLRDSMYVKGRFVSVGIASILESEFKG